MIARLHVLLTQVISMPEGTSFTVWEYEDQGYRVRLLPPVKTDSPAIAAATHQVLIDNKPAVSADLLTIEFRRESFDRRSGSKCDPPEELIAKTINSFIGRFRTVTRAALMRYLPFPRCRWRLQYLNDDETELEMQEGFVRGRGSLNFEWSIVALTPYSWSSIHELQSDYVPPPWLDLLLEAQTDVPRVGPAIVLAATALEVLSSHVINILAQRQGVAPGLWEWITDRADPYQNPSVEDRFDTIPRILIGRSLKEDSVLWEAFCNLKKARNGFVHAGVAQIGNRLVTAERTLQLVTAANKICDFVRDWLPEDARWLKFEDRIDMQVIQPLH